MTQYWIKIILGMSAVSIPFLIAAIQKKIPWLFFWSWTFTSVFSTLTFLLIKDSMEKNLSDTTRLYVSIALGAMFVALGLYLRTIQSPNIKKIGWIFIAFGAAWIAIST